MSSESHLQLLGNLDQCHAAVQNNIGIWPAGQCAHLDQRKKAGYSTLMSHQRVGAAGLGIIGLAIVANSRRDGFRVWGFDPNPAARKNLKAIGGTVCKGAADLPRQVDAIITPLPSASTLQSTAVKLASGAQQGLVVIETSTLDFVDKLQVSKCIGESGRDPVRPPSFENERPSCTKRPHDLYQRTPSSIRKVKRVFRESSNAHFNLGAFGNGMKMRHVDNALVATHNVSTTESLLLGQRWGIAQSTAVKVLAGGCGWLAHAAGAWSADGKRRLEDGDREGSCLAKGYEADCNRTEGDRRACTAVCGHSAAVRHSRRHVPWPARHSRRF